MAGPPLYSFLVAEATDQTGSKELKKKPSPTAEGLDLDSLQTELTRLVDQIHNVQQQMGHLESGKTVARPQLAREISEAAKPASNFKTVPGLMGRPMRL